MKTRSCVGLILTCMAVLGPFGIAEGQDEEIEVERHQVLSRLGGGGLIDLPLMPEEAGPGVVHKRTVSRAEATRIRFRFTVKNDGHDWTIQLLNPTGELVWSRAHDVPHTASLWSEELKGDRFSVELVTSTADSTTHIVLDRVVTDVQASTPISIIIPDRRESIAMAPEWMKIQGRSIARLRFVSDVDGKPYGCTAFLVAKDLLLTNEHCVRSDAEVQSALVDFDYDQDDSSVTALPLSELVRTDAALDFAVLRLAAPIDRPALKFDTTPVTEGEDLVVIQHADRKPKQISQEDCRVSGANRVGRTSERTDFGHTCDTLGGSSGSPVFRIASEAVVGLHHLGIPRGRSTLVNRAAHMQKVVAKLPAEAGGPTQ